MMNLKKDEGLISPKGATELLDLYFLEIRSHLLEAAAGVDRIERAPDGEKAMKDPRMECLMKALPIMTKPGAQRAPQFLELFSEL